MKLSKEKEYLVVENQKLVHYLVQKLGLTANSAEYEDIVSIGMIGLVKAAITFDSSKDNTFATYASRCINNEIFMYHRKAKKYAKEISIDEPIGADDSGKEISLRDTIEDPDSNFFEQIANREDFIRLIKIILNCLKGRERIVMLYWMTDMQQREIAKILNISRSYVSRIETQAIRKIQEIVNQQVDCKEVFSVNIRRQEYIISFSPKVVREFNKIFAKFLQNLASAATLPDFKVSCRKERIIIQIPADPGLFFFIAQIFQEIEKTLSEI